MTSDSIKKVPFLAWIKWNAERMRSCCDWFRSDSLNTVLLNWFIKDLIQIYGQGANFWWFVRKQNAFYGQTGIFQWFVRKFLAIILGIYGQKPLFGEFVRKRQWFCRIKRPINQHTNNLPPASFRLLAIVTYAQKNRIRFAIDCKSSGFSIWSIVFSQPFFS